MFEDLDFTALSVAPFYANYFNPLKKIGYLKTGADNNDYYTVPSNIGNIAILSAADFNTHQSKHIGGEYRLYILDRKDIEHPKGLTKSFVTAWCDLYQQYPFLVMVTGSDDGHLAYYFKSEKEAMSILNEISTIDELRSLANSSSEVSSMIKNKEIDKIKNILIIEDVRN